MLHDALTVTIIQSVGELCGVNDGAISPGRTELGPEEIVRAIRNFYQARNLIPRRLPPWNVSQAPGLEDPLQQPC